MPVDSKITAVSLIIARKTILDNDDFNKQQKNEIIKTLNTLHRKLYGNIFHYKNLIEFLGNGKTMQDCENYFFRTRQHIANMLCQNKIKAIYINGDYFYKNPQI